MKHGPAGCTPSFVPSGSIQDALSIRVQGMDEATDATTTAATAAPCANSVTLMKHSPAGFTPSFVPYGSIQDALSIRVQEMDEARPVVRTARQPQSSAKGSSLTGRLRVRHGAEEADTCRLYYDYYDYYC